MSRINRVPKGLQYLLGNTNFGDNPSELAGNTQGTVDLFPFLGADLIDYAYGSLAADTLNQFISLEVPENELWLIQSIAATINFENIGDTINLSAELFDVIRIGAIAPGIAYPLSDTGVITSVQIGELKNHIYTPAHLIPLPSGSKVQCNVNQITTATFVFLTLQCQYYRLLV